MKFRYTPRCSAGGPSSAGNKVAPTATPVSRPSFTTALATWQGLTPAASVREPRESSRLQPTTKSPEPSCSHPLTMTKECRGKPKSGLFVSRAAPLSVQRVPIISFSGGNSRKGLRMNFRGPEGLDVAVAKERCGEIVVFSCPNRSRHSCDCRSAGNTSGTACTAKLTFRITFMHGIESLK
jgi:hypothetical protein